MDHFIGRFNRLRGKDILGVSPDVLRVLLAHDFPGNVRELENIIEHAFILCTGGMVRPEHLPDSVRPEDLPEAARPARTLQELESWFIHDALRRHGWNRLATAKELGVHKMTLWQRIKHLGLQIPEG